MYTNKKFYFLTSLIVVFSFSYYLFDYYKDLVHGIQGKYVIILDELSNDDLVDDFLIKYSPFSTEYSLKLNVLNDSSNFNVNWTDKKVITLGSFSSHDDCFFILQDIVNKYKIDSKGVLIDTNSVYPEWVVATRKSYEIEADENTVIRPFVLLKNAVLENFPLQSFNKSPLLEKGDTVYCSTYSNSNDFKMCKFKSDTSILNGFIESSLLKLVNDKSYFDLVAEKDSILLEVSLKKDSVKFLESLYKKQLEVSDSLQNFIHNHNKEIIDCDKQLTLLIQSYNKFTSFFISTKKDGDYWTSYKEYKINNRSLNSKGFTNVYELKLNDINLYRYYVVDKNGKLLVGSYNKPVVESVCSQSKIFLPK